MQIGVVLAAQPTDFKRLVVVVVVAVDVLGRAADLAGTAVQATVANGGLDGLLRGDLLAPKASSLLSRCAARCAPRWRWASTPASCHQVRTFA